ncbi:MAG: hypothetical protein MJ252_10710, partial [archaeon]|nr:hypothetical protein [archaeon]
MERIIPPFWLLVKKFNLSKEKSKIEPRKEIKGSFNLVNPQNVITKDNIRFLPISQNNLGSYYSEIFLNLSFNLPEEEFLSINENFLNYNCEVTFNGEIENQKIFSENVSFSLDNFTILTNFISSFNDFCISPQNYFRMDNNYIFMIKPHENLITPFIYIKIHEENIKILLNRIQYINSLIYCINIRYNIKQLESDYHRRNISKAQYEKYKKGIFESKKDDYTQNVIPMLKDLNIKIFQIEFSFPFPSLDESNTLCCGKNDIPLISYWNNRFLKNQCSKCLYNYNMNQLLQTQQIINESNKNTSENIQPKITKPSNDVKKVKSTPLPSNNINLELLSKVKEKKEEEPIDLFSVNKEKLKEILSPKILKNDDTQIKDILDSYKELYSVGIICDLEIAPNKFIKIKYLPRIDKVEVSYNTFCYEDIKSPFEVKKTESNNILTNNDEDPLESMNDYVNDMDLVGGDDEGGLGENREENIIKSKKFTETG